MLGRCDNGNAHQYMSAATNANFNVSGLVDANGSMIERYEYTPYGQRTVYKKSGLDDDLTSAPLWASQRVITSDAEEQPYGLNDIGHQGLPHDDESGLIYNRYRYVIPRLGRYNGPDKAGYADGMGLHEDRRSNPVRYVDPLGLEIAADCEITKRLTDNGVKDCPEPEPWIHNGKQGYLYSGRAGFNNGNVKAEILATMIRSRTTFSIKGETLEEEIKNLERHVAVRMRTIARARSVNFGFPAGKPPEFRGAIMTGKGGRSGEGPWQGVQVGRSVEPVPRGSAHDAVTDIWKTQSSYSMGCMDAAAAAFACGVADTVGKKTYDEKIAEELKSAPKGAATLMFQADAFFDVDGGVSQNDWIPGDWSYVPNPRPKKDPYQGEHIIYLGCSKAAKMEYWGHTMGVRPWSSIQKAMSEFPWNNKGQVNPSEVKASKYRYRPTEGLEPTKRTAK